METCGNCKFWLRSVVEKDGGVDAAPDGSGLCRRYPPIPMTTHWVGQTPGIAKPGAPPQVMYSVVNTGCAFPVMLEVGYCGEFQPSASTPRH